MTKAKPGFYKGCDIGKPMGNEMIMKWQPLFFISKDQDPTHSCKERTVGPYEM